MAYEALAEKLAMINPALAESITKNAWVLPSILLQAIMKLIFYPIALYYSARRKQKAWFVVLIICFLVLNDFGLLPILYLVFNKEKNKNLIKEQKTSKKKKM